LIKAVLFDYGGTLVLSAHPWERAKPEALNSVYRFLRRKGLKATYEEYLEKNEAVFGRYAELETRQDRDIADRLKYIDLIVELFPNLPKRFAKALAFQANGIFWKVVVDNYHPRRGARACLEALKAMGLKMGVVSNHHNHEWLVRSLRRYGIQGYFGSIISSERVGLRKPNPKIFQFCLSALKVKEENALFVGDSAEFDVAGAKRAGLVAVLIGHADPSGSRPDFVISKLGEIPRIVDKLNRG